MSFRTAILSGCLLAFALSFGARNGCAQEEPQEPIDTQPKPAARTYPIPIIDSGNPQDENSVQDTTNGLQPDMTPLTGVQNATLGSPEIRHSYWVPGFQYASTGYSQPNSTGWFADNYLIANVSLLKVWSRSQLALNYSGGGFFSTYSPPGSVEQLAFAQNFQWNRLNVQILDQFSYLPESQFGFGGGTNLGIAGIAGSLGPSLPGLGPSSVPNQSIQTSIGARYSNTPIIQASYQTSPRGSITAWGSYQILSFVEPGYINSNAAIGGLGYNYLVSREDTIGILYRFSSYQYPGQPQAYGDNIVNLAYSRKVTGRLALQLYGGAEFTTFRVPIGTESSRIGSSASANLTYGFEKSSLFAGYLHGLTNGSGVITGSIVDQVTFRATQNLGRVWSAYAYLNYAHNKTVANSTRASSPTYNTWFVGAGLNRPFGRNVNFGISYTANINNQSGCSGTSCSTNQNSITLNLQWHTSPFVLP